MSLILNPTRSRTHTVYGIEYETTTFSTGVTCTMPTDEPSRATDLASLIVEGCARSPMEYEDFRDAGLRTLHLRQTLRESNTVKRCNVYQSADGYIVKDPIDNGNGSMQFFYMNALHHALDITKSNINAVCAPAIITSPNGRSYVIFEKAPGFKMSNVIFEWRDIHKTEAGYKKNEVKEIISSRISEGLKLLRPAFIINSLTNDHPAHKTNYNSGTGNTFIDIDLDKLSLEALYAAPIWLIDQAHPTIRTRAIHKIARHFPLVSAK